MHVAPHTEKRGGKGRREEGGGMSGEGETMQAAPHTEKPRGRTGRKGEIWPREGSLCIYLPLPRKREEGRERSGEECPQKGSVCAYIGYPYRENC